jgi:hypothetical protein
VVGDGAGVAGEVDDVGAGVVEVRGCVHEATKATPIVTAASRRQDRGSV